MPVRESYCPNKGFDSKTLFFFPQSFSRSLPGCPDVEGMDTRGGNSYSQTLFIWVSAPKRPLTHTHT